MAAGGARDRAKNVARGRPRRPAQQGLPFRTHGGKRAGAGRPKDKSRNLVTHAIRPDVTEGTPVHVTLRVLPHVYGLRSERSFEGIANALRAARERTDFRVVHFSVQGNHVHLVVEASDRHVLSRRIKGLEISVARAMNRIMKRKGRVFADRYHMRVLSKPRDVRNVLAYVLKNRARHVGPRAALVDRYSSAHRFDGWDVRLTPPPPDAPMLVSKPVGWLLRTGWKRWGLLSLRS